MKRMSNWTVRCVLTPLLFGLLLLGGTAHAGELDAAIRNGAVGETARGYVAPVSSPTASVTRLINGINAKRREKYQSLARKHNTPLSQIESVVGKRLMERAPAGAYIQDSSGAWRRK